MALRMRSVFKTLYRENIAFVFQPPIVHDDILRHARIDKVDGRRAPQIVDSHSGVALLVDHADADLVADLLPDAGKGLAPVSALLQKMFRKAGEPVFDVTDYTEDSTANMTFASHVGGGCRLKVTLVLRA